MTETPASSFSTPAWIRWVPLAQHHVPVSPFPHPSDTLRPLPRCRRSWRSQRTHPSWSWTTRGGASTPSSSPPPSSRQVPTVPSCLRGTGENPPLFPPALPPPESPQLSFCSPPPSSYDGFPTLRPELLEPPRDPLVAQLCQARSSAPSSPAPRRTKQVSRANGVTSWPGLSREGTAWQGGAGCCLPAYLPQLPPLPPLIPRR